MITWYWFSFLCCFSLNQSNATQFVTNYKYKLQIKLFFISFDSQRLASFWLYIMPVMLLYWEHIDALWDHHWWPTVAHTVSPRLINLNQIKRYRIIHIKLKMIYIIPSTPLLKYNHLKLFQVWLSWLFRKVRRLYRHRVGPAEGLQHRSCSGTIPFEIYHSWLDLLPNCYYN